jgi:hypothetical protein
MKLRVILCAACAFCLTANSEALAQHHQRLNCGTGQDASDDLAEYEKYFRDSEFAVVRKDKIRQLSANDTQEVVSNGGTCQAVLQAALRMLRRYDPNWPQVERRGYDFTVLRYGPYYGILMKVSDDPATGPPHFIPLIIFRQRRLEYVTTILV